MSGQQVRGRRGRLQARLGDIVGVNHGFDRYDDPMPDVKTIYDGGAVGRYRTLSEGRREGAGGRGGPRLPLRPLHRQVRRRAAEPGRPLTPWPPNANARESSGTMPGTDPSAGKREGEPLAWTGKRSASRSRRTVFDDPLAPLSAAPWRRALLGLGMASRRRAPVVESRGTAARDAVDQCAVGRAAREKAI